MLVHLFVFAENLQFAVTILFIYMLAKLSPIASLSHLWLKGLEFCVPPTDQFIDDLITEPPRKKASKKRQNVPIKPERKPIVLHLAQISSPCLQDHFFYEEFDFLVISFALTCCTIIFYELWSISVPAIFHSESKVLLQPSKIGFGLLVLEIAFCLKLMFSIIKQAGSESYEMRYSLLTAIVSSILCFFIIDAPEYILNFGLSEGFVDVLRIRHEVYPFIPHAILNFTILRSFLSIVAGFLAGLAVYPGLRLARCHFLLLCDMKSEGFLSKFNILLSGINFVLPIFCILSWFDPLTRNLLVREDSFIQLTNGEYEDLRLLLLVVVCVIRLYLVRVYVQVYLNTALSFAELFIDCTDKRILMILRDRIYGVYAYLCVACVQLIAPVFLLLFFALEMKSGGDLRLGLFSPLQQEPASTSLLSPSFIRAIFSFLTWWFISWWFLVSVIGFAFEKARASRSFC